MYGINKQAKPQRYIFKIHSGRLRRAKWKLTLPLPEARRNDEVVALADSQVLRWLDELNGSGDSDAAAGEVRAEISRLRSQPGSMQSRRAIRKLYERLDELQMRPDYLCLVIDRKKDYHRACRGFSVNGVKYERLLGTNGGVKNSTIVFISEKHAAEIKRRIDNGRDMTVPQVPAKLEAYKALTCSASVPVSAPNGIIVVKDCETEFLADVIYLNDRESGEPLMTEQRAAPVTLNESDGYGLMLPALARRWSEELGLDYVASGINTRFCWEKGMVFTFDFADFAETVAGKYIVTDAWGAERDIRDVELVLTTSMVKLWDSYESCEEYLANSLDNGYTFGITKVCPKELERERALNYQFIQSYDLTDADIETLTEPTARELRSVLQGGSAETLLFLKGTGMTEHSVLSMPDDYVKALMIEPELIRDQYVQSNIYQTVRGRINDAKVGVLKVHGNYSVVCGDPYALCQSIFGMEVTGLLSAGEIYSKYWSDAGTTELACFRAPMTCHNNIRKVRPHTSLAAGYWYRHLETCTLFNCWDAAAAALNGMDKDGDLVMLTDNRVLVSRLEELPALMCMQRKAEKKIATEDDAVRANISSFGDDIGKITNRITSMYEVRARFPKGSAEYEELDYRIKCGQKFQQDAIDKAKGIISKPMPRAWYDRRAAIEESEPDARELCCRIVADRKPYFMRHIYPLLMRQYNRYIKNTDKNAMREFRMTVQELYAVPEEQRTDGQREFLRRYEQGMPVGISDCVMNRICRRFEAEFDRWMGKRAAEEAFDYSVLKSGAPYSAAQYRAVLKLYERYSRRLRDYAVFTKYERVDEDEAHAGRQAMHDEFVSECVKACPNRYSLCDIVLDICYRRNGTKWFAWEMCGAEIIDNLLVRNGGIISFPAPDAAGDIVFGGKRFSMKRVRAERAGGEA